MLLVQEYLLTHSLTELYAEHAVKGRISAERPFKVNLNYDQIEVVDSNPLSQQCRGLVLRTVDGSPMTEDKPVGDTVILSLPFFRFFNVGQGAAAPVDLEHPETAIMEKLDGTFIEVYFDDIHGEWHTGTRSICEANLKINDFDYTFRSLFEKAFVDTTGRKFTDWAGEQLVSRTYMFELCTPMNQVVVPHPDYKVTLIGCRDTQTGHEHWPHAVAPELGVPHVARHRFGNMSEMLAFVAQRDPRMFEGIVACQETSPGVFQRVKIKNAQYMALSKLKDAVSSKRNIMTLILGESLDDAFCVMSEDIKAASIKMQEGVRMLLHNYRVQYPQLLEAVNAQVPGEVHGSKEHRKAFAIAAKAHGIWFDPAMMQYTGKIQDARGYIDQKKDSTGGYPDGLLDMLIEKATGVYTP